MLIEKINEAFISFLRDYRGTRYENYFRNINDRIIQFQGQLTTEQITTIIEEETADLDLEEVAIFGMLLSAITTIIENRRLTPKQRSNLAPILAIMAIYKVSSPDTFVRKMYTSLKAPKSEMERKAGGLLKNYVEVNSRTKETIINDQKRELVKSQRKAKIRMSKSVINDMQELAGKDYETTQRILRRKYNKSKALNRTIDTEMHANVERAKVHHSKAMGFTHKVWRTQGDSRVRDTRFHNQVSNKEVEINEDFIIGNKKASAPGDQRLPPGDRINCRCYLIYR